MCLIFNKIQEKMYKLEIFLQIKHMPGARDIAQPHKRLPGTLKILSSIPSTTKEKEKNECCDLKPSAGPVERDAVASGGPEGYADVCFAPTLSCCSP